MDLILDVCSLTDAAPSMSAILYAEDNTSGSKVYEVEGQNTHRTGVFSQAKTAQPWYAIPVQVPGRIRPTIRPLIPEVGLNGGGSEDRYTKRSSLSINKLQRLPSRSRGNAWIITFMLHFTSKNVCFPLHLLPSYL